MVNTQQHIPVSDIQDDMVFLKDGSVSLIIETSAVNFALLFETEQMGIIGSFAGFLNSLSFPIQIINLSRRLDVSTYLKTLDKTLAAQSNPLIAKMTIRYRQFVESLIKENDVLDKKFFICIYVSSAELSVLPQKFQEKSKKALIALNPRKDHVIRQLSKIGLKARQLSTIEITKLLYDIYNPPQNGEILLETPQETLFPPAPTTPSRPLLTRLAPTVPAQRDNPGFNVIRKAPATLLEPQVIISSPNPPSPPPYNPILSSNPRHPFVVEELRDDLGS